MSFPINYVCKFCGTKFKTSKSLETHIKTARYCIDNRNSDIHEIPKSSLHECEFCGKSFPQKQTHTRHLKTCLNSKTVITDELKLVTQNFVQLQIQYKLLETKLHQVEQKNVKLKQKYNSLEEKYIEVITQKIPALKADAAYEKGQVDGMKNAPPTTNIVNNTTRTNNSTLKNTNYFKNVAITTIKPFTIENLQSDILPQYTYEVFKQKLQGIANLVLLFTSLEVDGVMERNLISTDKKRDVFHALKETREWEKDGGISVCMKIVNVFHDKIEDYYYQLLKEDSDMRAQLKLLRGPNVIPTDEYKAYKPEVDAHWEFVQEITSTVYNPIHNGHLEENNKEYVETVKKIRDLIQPRIHFTK